MSKRAPIVEWHVADSDADWAAYTTPPRPEMTPDHGHLFARWFCWRVIAILFLAVGAASGWWYTTKVELHQVKTELRAAIQTSEPASHLDVEWDTVDVQGNQAVARIVKSAENGLPTSRQTRFYERTASGWRRVESDSARWGPMRSLETPSFVFHFRQYDAPTVMVVAPQVETLYALLQRHFGMARTPTTEQLIIEVSVNQSPAQTLLWSAGYDRFVVPSPSLYWAPVELSDSDLLAQAIVLPLLARVLTQAKEQHAVRANWQLMVSGLYLWQVWDLDLPLAAWREDVVRWIYGDLPGAESGQVVVLPKHYPELCANHRLWLASPMELNIPLICAEPKWEKINFSSWSSRGAVTRLDQLGLLMPNVELSAETQSQGRTVALATLIEYAVTTYGRERLPPLMMGLGQYETWETLLPAVFDVSAAEFEAGWQEFLATHYGVPYSPSGVNSNH